MRFGGPIFTEFSSPEEWVQGHQTKGYNCAFCPLGNDAPASLLQEFEQAAREADLVIAEVGAWSNPISVDEDERKRAVEHCQRQLALADAIGARCCVNIAGSLGGKWDGHHQDNLTEAAFDSIVGTTRAIIDAVQPTRAAYSLETMPWMFPDSVDSYARLVEAIDRPQFGVHFDPANLICSPQRYYANGALIGEAIERLGPRMLSCHAKDVLMGEGFMVHIDEVRPGLGVLDYEAYLTGLDGLADPDVCLLMEHLSTAEEYDLAAGHIRSVAVARGVALPEPASRSNPCQ